MCTTAQQCIYGYQYGVAIFSDVTLTAVTENLSITGKTNADDGCGIGFDTNNNLTGNSSVTILADSQEWDYGGTPPAISVQGNGSLELAPYPGSTDFEYGINLANVDFGTTFTSAKLGVPTATGYDLRVGTQGLRVNGPIEIYGGTPIIDGEIVSTAEGQSVLIQGASGIEVSKNISTTNGSLTLNGTTSATDSITLSSGSGDLTVTDALLATTAGTHDLNLNSTGTAKIGGAVGNSTGSATTFFNNLTTNAGGTTEFSGNIVALTQTFNDDIVLNGSMSMGSMGTAAGLTATFNGNVDATNSDIQLGFVSTAIDGANWSNLASLRFEGTEIAVQNTIQSTGDQTYDSTVNVVDNLTLDTGSGDLNISGPLLATTAVTHDVNINSTGTAKIGGAVGNGTGSATTFFNGLTTNAGGTTEFSGNVVALTQTFNDDIVLNGSMNMSGTTTNAGLSATFNGQVDATNSNIQLGFVSTAIDGANWSNLASLRFEGTDIGLQNTLQATGDQTYIATNPVHLDGDTILVGETLSIANGLDGQTKNLVLNFTQTTSLDGSFANITDLTSEGDVSLNGTITTLGNQAYNASVNLAGDTTLKGNSLSVANVDGQTKNLVLDFSQTTSIDGNFTNITDLTSEGTVSLNGTLSTLGNQSYKAVAQLVGDTTLAGNSATFADGVVGGNHDLVMNFTGPSVLNDGFVGIDDFTVIGPASVSGNLSAGAIDLQGAVTLSGDANLNASRSEFAPTEVGNLSFTEDAVDVALSSNGQYAFVVVKEQGLEIIDVSNPASPTPAGNLSITSGGVWGPVGVTLSSDEQYAFVTNFGGGLEIIDVSDVSDPTAVGNFDKSGAAAYDVALSSNGQYAFVASYMKGLQIVNISDKTAPTLAGSLDTDGLAVGVTLSSDGQHAFVADGTNGLQIIDVSDVSMPTSVGNLSTDWSASDVVLSSDDQYAFVADREAGLQIIDVSNVTAPKLAGHMDTVDAYSVTLSSDDQYAFVADQNAGLQIIDVSNVSAPTPAGNLDTDGWAASVTLSSDEQRAFVAGENAGLQIIDLAPGTPVAQPVQFGGTVDGGFGLAVTASNVTFSGIAGGVTPLASLTTVGDTTARLGGGMIETSGSQSFGGAVNLLADTTLVGDSLALSSGVEGGTKNLVLNFAQTTSLDGSFANITDLTSEGDVSLNGTITTLGNQVYNASANLAGDTTLEGSSLSVANVDGQTKNLVLNFAQTTSLDGSFANITDLTSEGDVSLNGTISTLGNQVYNASANLAGDTTLEGSSLSVANVDGQTKNLVLNFAQTTSLDGSFANINNLTSEGDVSLSGTISTLGNQVYNASANLAGDTTLEGSSLSVTNVDGQTKNLVLNFAQMTSLDGSFANITDLTSEGDVSLNGTITTLGNQVYNAGANLAGDTTLEGSSLSVANIDGQTKNLVLNFAQTTSLDGSFANIADLTSEGNVSLNGTISTLGNQSYKGDATLSGDTTLEGTSLALSNGLEGGTKNLVLNFAQTTSLDGSFANITDLTSEGNVSLNGTITTLGNQVYNAGANLAGDTTLEGSSLSVANVDGQTKNLVLDFAQTTSLDGSFANITDLTSEGNVSLNGTISTLGNQSYKGDATLSGDTTLEGTSLALSNGLEGGTKNLVLNFAQTTSLDGSFANIADLTSEGDVSLNGSISTSGDQTYKADTILSGDTNIVTSGGDVTITGGTGGIYSVEVLPAGTGYSLSITAGAGSIIVGNETGFGDKNGTAALVNNLSLSSSTSTKVGSGNQVIGGDMNVPGGPLTLLGDALLGGRLLTTPAGVDGAGHNLNLGFTKQTTIDGNFSNIKDLKSSFSVALEGTIVTSGYQEYSSSAVLVDNATLQGTDLTFSNGLDGNAKNLDLNFSNTTFLNDDYANIANLTSEGDVSLSGTITTSGGQNYKAAVNLSDNTTLVGDSLSMANGLDGQTKNLDLNFSQTTSLDGSFTNINNLISEGDVSLNGNLTTLGDQTYQAAANLTGYAILEGESLLFSNGVDGASHSLGLDFSKSTDLNGTFENIDFLTSGGDVSLNGTIRTIESQTYNANVSLSGNTTLEGFVLSVASGVDGGGKNLDLNFSSTTSLSGGFSNIGNLVSEGPVVVEGTIQTLGSQTYNASVNLTGTVDLQGTSGNFGGAVNGNKNDLTLNFSAPTTIDGGSVFSGLANLTVTGPSDLGASIETSGVQTYEGPVTLLGATALKGQAGVFTSGVQGNGKGLVLDFNETVVIDGDNVFNNLGNLTVANNASLSGSIQTTGFQHYNGETTLLDHTQINTGTSGDVNFGTVDGSHDLSIEAGTGQIDFFGALGGATPLQSLNLASASAVEALDTLTIDGTGGSGPGLRFGPAVDNVNISQPESTITNAAQEGILFAGGSTDSTLANFTVTNSGGNGITMEGGDYTNTTIRDVVVTTSGAAAVSMSDDGHGLYANNAIGFTVTDSRMTSNKGSGVYVEGLASDGVTVSNSTFGIDGEGLGAGNKGYGVGFAGGSNHVADNNTIGGNDLTGLLAVSPVTGETVSNITFSNNWIGLTRSEEPVPNGQAGIWVLGDVTNSEGYTQGFVDDVKVQGNRVENAIFNGIEIDNATNVVVGGFEASEYNQINFSQQYGLAMTGRLTGTDVRGNTLNSNIDTGLYLHDVKGATIGGLSGALEIHGSNFGVTAIGDLTGTQLVANHIHSNDNAGAFLMKAKNFELFRNTIEGNGPYGVLAFEESTGTTLVGNTIRESEAGVWLSGVSGLTIGYAENSIDVARRKPNKITDNYNVGIIVQGSTAADNRILSNEIYLNKYYGIQFVGGAAPTVQPPRLFAASLDGDTTTVAGRLNGNPGDKYLIQYFQTKPEDIQPGRPPEGQIFIHSQMVEISSEGFFTLSTEIVKSGEHAIAAGDWVTTTATSIKDNAPDQTSVFSSGVRVREVQ